MTKEWTRLKIAALSALAAHLIAGLAMAFVLRHGLESNLDLAGRLAFLAGRRMLWVTSWVTWNLAALSILYFFYALRRVHNNKACSVAAVIAGFGVVADLTAETIEMFVLPPIASRAILHAPATVEFLHTHRFAVLLTGGLANGLYTAATWLVVISTWCRYQGVTRISGLWVGIAGIAVSLTALAGSTQGLVWANAALVLCIVAWQTCIAFDAHRQ